MLLWQSGKLSHRLSSTFVIASLSHFSIRSIELFSSVVKVKLHFSFITKKTESENCLLTKKSFFFKVN
ncbi:hypothetical protein JCM19047_3659 [Bacillus sp. JCM 19047]|nr:hypothetical protein JCM19047_3659 [Bacillus sp. JCM 19047]